MKAKNIRGIFTGYRGQKIFNYLYSIGASIVILGAMFKLLHVPYADPILILGMGTEAVIFFLSAFDEPAKEYKWERVFADLENEEAEGKELPSVAGEVIMGGGVSSIPEGMQPAASPVIVGGGGGVSGPIVIGGGSNIGTSPIGVTTPVVEGGGGASGPIVIGGGGVTGNIGGVINAEETSAANEATTEYVRQLTEINESLAKLQASLSQNIQGLNAMYELQLRDVGSQLQSVSRVHSETEQMAKTIAELNAIYEKMLAAMQKN